MLQRLVYSVRNPDTGLYVGFVPDFPGAHTQAETLDELNNNMKSGHKYLCALWSVPQFIIKIRNLIHFS
jgi:hypothetical protein